MKQENFQINNSLCSIKLKDKENKALFSRQIKAILTNENTSNYLCSASSDNNSYLFHILYENGTLNVKQICDFLQEFKENYNNIDSLEIIKHDSLNSYDVFMTSYDCQHEKWVLIKLELKDFTSNSHKILVESKHKISLCVLENTILYLADDNLYKDQTLLFEVTFLLKESTLATCLSSSLFNKKIVKF